MKAVSSSTTTKQISALRQGMIGDMALRNMPTNTQEVYACAAGLHAAKIIVDNLARDAIEMDNIAQCEPRSVA